MTEPNTNPQQMVSLKELAELLVRRFGYTEGTWDLAIEFKVAIGNVGPKIDEVLPGAIVQLSRVGLTRSTQSGPHTVNAAESNPAASEITSVKEA